MKRAALSALCCLFIAAFTFAQTTTETFETESSGSASFTDNGVTFSIISHIGTFTIVNYLNTGWNGTAKDNQFIDNTSSVSSTSPSFSIKTTSNLFKVNRFWVYVADRFTNPNVAGTLSVTGKLSGVTKFSALKSTSFEPALNNNGYTLIDMTNLNGQNYSNIVIDQLQLTLGGDYKYIGLDAFTWVKDANIVLPVHFGAVNAVVKNNTLKVNWETQTETNNDHFTIEASKDGNTFTSITTVKSKAAEGNSSKTIGYEWTSNGAFSLAALPLMAFLLVSLASFRRRKNLLPGLALVTGIFIMTASCNKSTDAIASGENYYIRIAQVDKDGTTTYSKVIKIEKD